MYEPNKWMALHVALAQQHAYKSKKRGGPAYSLPTTMHENSSKHWKSVSMYMIHLEIIFVWKNVSLPMIMTTYAQAHIKIKVNSHTHKEFFSQNGLWKCMVHHVNFIWKVEHKSRTLTCLDTKIICIHSNWSSQFSCIWKCMPYCQQRTNILEGAYSFSNPCSSKSKIVTCARSNAFRQTYSVCTDSHCHT